MPQRFIDTDRFSDRLRARVVDLERHRLLITNFRGSRQELDLTEPANCNGFGRIRHFHLDSNPGWPKNPLPIEPARRALGLGSKDVLRAQAFQMAACNWRCWYCFVDRELVSADRQHAAFFSPSQLIDLFLGEPNRPEVIDLTGGQPDLVPEWVPWMMRELRSRGLEDKIYLWSDDNLSTDYFWRFLTNDDLDLVSRYCNYGKVCCFKGFDANSFSFNTGAAPELFQRQFSLVRHLLALDIDLYCYTTFTTPTERNMRDHMTEFVDKLQELDPNLPLRTVPLRVRIFTPNRDRAQTLPPVVLSNQNLAVEAWMQELTKRYSSRELEKSVAEVPLRNHRRRGQ